MDAGEIIRTARRSAGLNQTELARRIGTTQPVVSRWERGHDEPRYSTLLSVAQVCGFRLDVRLTEIGEACHDQGVDRAQIRQQLALSPEQRLASVINLSRTLTDIRRIS